MTALWASLATIVAAALGILGWRVLRKPNPEITPLVVDLAEKRAGALAAEKEAEAKARAATIASAGELADAEARGRAKGLAKVLDEIGARRK